MTDADDDIHGDLESLLRGLPLRRPSAALDRRVAAAAAGRRWHPVRWAAVAATLLLAVGVAWRWPRPAVPPVARATVVDHPVSVERDTSRLVDDGVVTVNDHVPYRQVRRQSVREIWWTDPATGAKLWAVLPAERVTVEPAETF